MANVQLTFSYANTEYKRMYDLEIADSLEASAKTKILAINESLKASTDGGLSEFFVGENGENFTLISSAKFIVTQENYIDLGGE